MKITKNNLYQFLFIICVAVPYFDMYELTFGIWLCAVLLTLCTNYAKPFVYQLCCFAAILTIAFISSFFIDYKAYNFVRDITYLLKPILGLLVGYQITRNYLVSPLRTVIYTGLIIATLHLLLVLYAVIFLGATNVNALRFYAGFFSDFEVYALIVIIFSKKLGMEFSRAQMIKYITVIAISSVFYLSRTNFIQFAILFMAMKGYFEINRRAVIILSSVVISSLVFYSAILYINPRRNGAGIEAFLYKVKIAPTEPFRTKINNDDYKDFNDNYRSVENILTMNQMTIGDTYTILFGKGLGSAVNLHTEVMAGDGTLLTSVSVMHNGFMTAFLKSGVVGDIILITSILLLLLNVTRGDEFKHINYMIIGTVVFLFVSYWVFMGYFFKADTKSILVGLFIALIGKMRKETRQQKTIAA